jgi:SAM-dependent methyltransferase
VIPASLLTMGYLLNDYAVGLAPDSIRPSGLAAWAPHGGESYTPSSVDTRWADGWLTVPIPVYWRVGARYDASMGLHPLAERFASVVDHYERGRPEYAPAVTSALMAELGLCEGMAVLDLAAGTGKLTRALLAAGLDVVAVEPQGALRERLAVSIGPERVREGLAEAIPLAEESVYAVTIADAFHWFDQQAALAEIRRVLRPDGGLAVLSTIPDWSGTSWAHELGSLVASRRPEHPYFDGPPWQDAIRAAGCWTEPREIRVTTTQGAQPERIVDHLASMSWVAAMPGEQRAELISQMRALIESGETPAELPLHVVMGLTSLA